MADTLQVVELAAQSDTGRVRDHNEDRCFASADLVAVADGMGGALAGEVAAQVAVDAMEQVSTPIDAMALKRAIEGANRAIRTMAARDAAKAGMGTTMTAVVVAGGHAEVIHVGDSRAYLWRDGTLTQLTDDHSVVAELVRRGTISQAEAEEHPHRNVITRALGAEAEVQVDRREIDVRSGDVLLLSSDGLHGEISDADIAGTLAEGGPLEDLARSLVDRANDAGGADNITVVLARIGDGEPASALSTNRPVDTAEFPVIEGARGAGTPGRATTVIGGVRSSVPEGAEPARSRGLLEPVEAPRRRLSPLIAGVVAVVVLLGGATTWALSRAYSIEQGAGGTLWVREGIALGPIDLANDWQDTGIPAGEVADGPLRSDVSDVGGQGATVWRAVRIIFSDGIPEAPQVTAADPVRRLPGLGGLASSGGKG
ncbi:MAG: Stp1/IreP family PP2C-type Ser/Thr phosphatase [Actinobacteria bacterium]|nr:Stp1/IreP family PP2C-type Ser/Thr phosphatase [Actinomycetota bacterium]